MPSCIACSNYFSWFLVLASIIHLYKAKRGDYEIEEIYYATSHARVGCTFPVGCITVKGKMSCTINPPWPLISEERSKTFADAFVEILKVVATEQG
mmetsp:Transcript_32451/g.66489  ORF Transcript_32451/g.66489 Transcript_32451/m.66489 type:complete len:96 (+) Transcript_32451:1-288(+)